MFWNYIFQNNELQG